MTITIAPNFTQRAYFWTAFKAIMAVKGFPHQHEDDGITHTIWGYDGPEAYICNIWKGDVPEAVVNAGYSQAQNDTDKSNFTTSYLSTANKTIDVTKPFADPIGFRARMKGVKGTATKNTSTNIDYKLTEDRWINGVQIILKDHEFEDTVKFQIVDVDNIFGYGAGLVLDEFGSDWNLSSDKQDQGIYVLSYPAKILANLYIRIVYISTGTVNDVRATINYFLHKKT